MYHPTIVKLDAAAHEIHPVFPDQARKLFLMAGEIQQTLVKHSPIQTNRRFFNAQWCWALGHIGILYQLIRWFKLTSPDTKLILETQGLIANQYFLSSLFPYIEIYNVLPDELREEAAYNAVYFTCPDGKDHIHDFMHIAEKECQGINLLELSDDERDEVSDILRDLDVGDKQFLCIQARNLSNDPKRNVSLEQCEKALQYYKDRGYGIISTGLDPHPINEKYPSVLSLENPRLASYLLSASCDQFIGSDSGAWTIPWAFRRPVELINDDLFAAWIYP